MPVAITARGISPSLPLAPFGAWTSARPPASLTRLMPITPSLPRPSRMTPAPCAPISSASERSNRSIGARGSRPGSTTSSLRWNAPSQSAGTTYTRSGSSLTRPRAGTMGSRDTARSRSVTLPSA